MLAQTPRGRLAHSAPERVSPGQPPGKSGWQLPTKLSSLSHTAQHLRLLGLYLKEVRTVHTKHRVART